MELPKHEENEENRDYLVDSECVQKELMNTPNVEHRNSRAGTDPKELAEICRPGRRNNAENTN